MEPDGSSPYSQEPAKFRGVLQYFVTWLVFSGEELLAPRPTPRLEDHHLSAVRYCLFNTFAATLHIWRSFLHPQPKDAPCSGDRDPLTTVIPADLSAERRLLVSCLFLPFLFDSECSLDTISTLLRFLNRLLGPTQSKSLHEGLEKNLLCFCYFSNSR